MYRLSLAVSGVSLCDICSADRVDLRNADRCCRVQGPELLVTVIRDVGQLNSPAGIQAITTSLDTLGVVISRTTVHAGHGNDGLRYWLRAPRSGRYEYQVLVNEN